MAKNYNNTLKDKELDALLKARDRAYSILQAEGFTSAGVGIGYNKSSQSWELAVHTEENLPSSLDAKLRENCTNVRIERVGKVIAY